MFGWELPPYNSGGLGTACLGLTQGLASLGIEIDFVLPKVFGPYSFQHMRILSAVDYATLEEIEKILDLSITDQEIASRSSGYGQHGPQPAELATHLREYGIQSLPIPPDRQAAWYAYLAGKIAAAQNDFNLIHCHDWFTYQCGIAARAEANKQGRPVPFIAHVHATEIDRSGGGEGNQAIMEIERTGLWQADHVVTVSSYTKELVKKFYGIAEEKISVVHNGLPAHYHPPRYNLLELKKHFKLVLFMGRITLQKGPDYFLRLAKTVTDQDATIKFLMVGSGDMERSCIEEAARLGLTGKVLFSPFLRGVGVDRAYQLADVFVMPSVSEPFGLAALEAIQNGTPVIVSRQAGVAEVIPNLRQVDFWDIEEMRRAVLEILYQPSLSQRIVREGRKYLKLTTWQHSAKMLRDIYRQCLYA